MESTVIKFPKQIQVTYIDHMGTDLSVVNAARVSFGKTSKLEEQPHGPARLKENDSKLINYLAKHKHLSPFGHCFASFHVKAPVFVARQLVKHKYLRWNEISRRYVASEPEFYIPDFWRKMAENVKQGSTKEQLVIDGVKVCKYCHIGLKFLRKEDEKMKVFCTERCRCAFYRKHTDKGWATAKHTHLRFSALKRNLHFDLTLQDVMNVGRPKVCKYLEIELDYTSTKIAPNSPSINRIDPSLGYVKGNIEVISNQANSMLLNATRKELKTFVKNVGLTQFGVFTESTNSVDGLYQEMKVLYKRLIDGGMCAEQARMFMPTSQMTEWHWSGSLDALAAMCKLRCASDTQKESREAANQIHAEMAKLYPVSWKALIES